MLVIFTVYLLALPVGYVLGRWLGGDTLRRSPPMVQVPVYIGTGIAATIPLYYFAAILGVSSITALASSSVATAASLLLLLPTLRQPRVLLGQWLAPQNVVPGMLFGLSVWYFLRAADYMGWAPLGDVIVAHAPLVGLISSSRELPLTWGPISPGQPLTYPPGMHTAMATVNELFHEYPARMVLYYGAALTALVPALVLSLGFLATRSLFFSVVGFFAAFSAHPNLGVDRWVVGYFYNGPYANILAFALMITFAGYSTNVSIKQVDRYSWAHFAAIAALFGAALTLSYPPFAVYVAMVPLLVVAMIPLFHKSTVRVAKQTVRRLGSAIATYSRFGLYQLLVSFNGSNDRLGRPQPGGEASAPRPLRQGTVEPRTSFWVGALKRGLCTGVCRITAFGRKTSQFLQKAGALAKARVPRSFETLSAKRLSSPSSRAAGTHRRALLSPRQIIIAGGSLAALGFLALVASSLATADLHDRFWFLWGKAQALNEGTIQDTLVEARAFQVDPTTFFSLANVNGISVAVAMGVSLLLVGTRLRALAVLYLVVGTLVALSMFETIRPMVSIILPNRSAMMLTLLAWPVIFAAVVHYGRGLLESPRLGQVELGFRSSVGPIPHRRLPLLVPVLAGAALIGLFPTLAPYVGEGFSIGTPLNKRYVWLTNSEYFQTDIGAMRWIAENVPPDQLVLNDASRSSMYLQSLKPQSVAYHYNNPMGGPARPKELWKFWQRPQDIALAAELFRKYDVRYVLVTADPSYLELRILGGKGQTRSKPFSPSAYVKLLDQNPFLIARYAKGDSRVYEVLPPTAWRFQVRPTDLALSTDGKVAGNAWAWGEGSIGAPAIAATAPDPSPPEPAGGQQLYLNIEVQQGKNQYWVVDLRTSGVEDWSQYKVLSFTVYSTSNQVLGLVLSDSQKRLARFDFTTAAGTWKQVDIDLTQPASLAKGFDWGSISLLSFRTGYGGSLPKPGDRLQIGGGRLLGYGEQSPAQPPPGTPEASPPASGGDTSPPDGETATPTPTALPPTPSPTAAPTPTTTPPPGVSPTPTPTVTPTSSPTAVPTPTRLEPFTWVPAPDTAGQWKAFSPSGSGKIGQPVLTTAGPGEGADTTYLQVQVPDGTGGTWGAQFSYPGVRDLSGFEVLQLRLFASANRGLSLSMSDSAKREVRFDFVTKGGQWQQVALDLTKQSKTTEGFDWAAVSFVTLLTGYGGPAPAPGDLFRFGDATLISFRSMPIAGSTPSPTPSVAPAATPTPTLAPSPTPTPKPTPTPTPIPRRLKPFTFALGPTMGTPWNTFKPWGTGKIGRAVFSNAASGGGEQGDRAFLSVEVSSGEFANWGGQAVFASLQDWSGYDVLQFQVYANANRGVTVSFFDVAKREARFHFATQSGGWQRVDLRLDAPARIIAGFNWSAVAYVQLSTGYVTPNPGPNDVIRLADGYLLDY
ncbi:MAG: hypothetical protein HY683_05175 [Chloroflexi bacterium]|nr:hypothetical protein [Chloroflexota bacterium]